MSEKAKSVSHPPGMRSFNLLDNRGPHSLRIHLPPPHEIRGAHLVRLIRFLAVIEDDVPLLGICLGSQLIAKALGARVYRNAQLEIGWEPVWLTDAGKSDALFQGVESPEAFFHCHGETFDLPAGAEWLAYSEKCRHQAYRIWTPSLRNSIPSGNYG